MRDYAPLYRSVIGFDRVANLLDSMNRNEQQPSFPPYNIEVTGENTYCISMAVAGFDERELAIEVKPNLLTISGQNTSTDNERNYLHRGIAARNFERRFQLADYVRVQSADLKNGLLHIQLVREIPEAMKPRTIKIGATDPSLDGDVRDSSTVELTDVLQRQKAC